MPPHESLPQPSEAPKRVIVVDSDSLSRRYLAHALQLDGFKVRLAADGHGLRSGLDQAVPEIVVLNVALRDESGLELCRELRATERTADTVIVVMSAANSSATATRIDEVRALAAGADRFMPTVGSADAFVQAINDALGAVVR